MYFDRWHLPKQYVLGPESVALNFLFPSRQVSPRDNFDVSLETQARSKRRSTHVPNLTDELGTAEEQRLNQFGSAG